MRGGLYSTGVNIPTFGVKRALYHDFRYPIVHEILPLPREPLFFNLAVLPRWGCQLAIFQKKSHGTAIVKYT